MIKENDTMIPYVLFFYQDVTFNLRNSVYLCCTLDLYKLALCDYM